MDFGPESKNQLENKKQNFAIILSLNNPKKKFGYK